MFENLCTRSIASIPLFFSMFNNGISFDSHGVTKLFKFQYKVPKIHAILSWSLKF